MAGFIVNPALNPSTGSSSQLQRMKKFTLVSAIHSPADQQIIKHLAWQCQAFLLLTLVFTCCNFICFVIYIVLLIVQQLKRSTT